MQVYYILLSYIIILLLISKPILKDKKLKKLLFSFCFLPTWLIMGLRYGVGADYFSYNEIFENVGKNYFSYYYYIEKGYLFLNVLIHKFSSDSMYLFLVTSFLIVYFFMKKIWESSEDIILSMILFLTLGYYFNAMNAVRQFMAIAISFYAIKYVKKEEWLKFFLSVAIAALFHNAVWMLIPLYVAVILLKEKTFYIMSTIGFASVSIWGMDFLFFLRNLIRNLFGANYDWINKFIIFNVTQERFSVPNVMLGVSSFIGGYYVYQKNKNNQELSVYLKYNWVAILCFCFLYKWGRATTRIAFFCTPVYILIIPMIIKGIKNVKIRLLFYTILFVICGTYLYNMLLNSIQTGNNFIPYMSVFKK